MGNEKALLVYKNLLQHTHRITKDIDCKKYLFYSDFVDQNDLWSSRTYIKSMQSTGDLGHRMKEAFRSVLLMEDKAVIIGSDCPELSSDIIEEAFRLLNNYDVVIGPTKDGGYYMLGMKALHLSLFKNIDWSTSEVSRQTIEKIEQEGLSYKKMTELSDLDNEDDLGAFPIFGV